jgi:hypothetical protein
LYICSVNEKQLDMQVFIIGSVIDTAKCLDSKRLNKQIIECRQILDAIRGKSEGWKNHPCIIQYKHDVAFLEAYLDCLAAYKRGDITLATDYSWEAWVYQPTWHTQDYYNNMKRRLYTKDHEYYNQFADLGESFENWYWINNSWKIYKQN